MPKPLKAIRRLVLVRSWGSIRSESLLVGLVIVIFAAFGTAQGPGLQPPIPAAADLQQAPGEAGHGAHRTTSNLSGNRARERPVVTPRFIDPGQRITVPQSSPLRNELIIGAVAAREIRRTLEIPGVVRADPARTVKVLPPVAGRVIDLKVQLGDRVAQQQELAVIYVGDLARARFGTREARPIMGLADKRIGFEGIGNGTASVGQQSAAKLEQPAAQLRALGGPLDGMQETRLLSVRAPIAGSVIDLRIAPGAVIDELSVSMMTIANLDTILVAANVSKREAALIAMGQPVHVRFPAYPGEDFKGETRLIGSAVDGDGRSIKVQIALQNPNIRLKANMFAYLTFFGPKETVPMVPISALVPTYAIDLVFVEVEPWIFEARAVGVGLLEDGQDIVANGLKIGDRIVVGGGGLLLRSQAQ
jgi:cobalt-zinc-cadmium efflux system membrane fusion protein